MNGRADTISTTVGVVLVNWNGAAETIPCIRSLRAGVLKPHRLVVVDNASHDGSSDLLDQNSLDVELIRNTANVGFTGAVNIGVSRLMSSGCDYIWILNNDTVVAENCLSALKSYMDLHSDVSACSGKIMYAHSGKLIWYAGATYNKWTMRSRHRGLRETDAGQYDRMEEVSFLSGCCMFIHRSAIELIGMFDEHFFAYYEDCDWCLRAQTAHLRLAYAPEAVIWHKVSASVDKVKDRQIGGTTSPFSVYITTRNRLYLIRKHSSNIVHTSMAVLVFIMSTGYYVTALTLLFRMEKVRALFRSLYDGMTQPLGTSTIIAAKPPYLQ